MSKTTFTVSVPDELKAKMDAHPEINWPEYLKQRLEARRLEFEKERKNANRNNHLRK